MILFHWPWHARTPSWNTIEGFAVLCHLTVFHNRYLIQVRKYQTKIKYCKGWMCETLECKDVNTLVNCYLPPKSKLTQKVALQFTIEKLIFFDDFSILTCENKKFLFSIIIHLMIIHLIGTVHWNGCTYSAVPSNMIFLGILIFNCTFFYFVIYKCTNTTVNIVI